MASRAAAKGGTGFGHEAPNEGATVEWYTPGWIFDKMGISFDLDPCTPPGGLSWIPAAKTYSLPTNGLTAPWDGKVWCNPPYGRATKDWMERMNRHRNGVALVFARTDTEWFHRSAANADALLFLEGRVKFVDDSGKPPKKDGKEQGPGAGSMLVAWGDECVAGLKRMATHGKFIPLK